MDKLIERHIKSVYDNNQPSLLDENSVFDSYLNIFEQSAIIHFGYQPNTLKLIIEYKGNEISIVCYKEWENKHVYVIAINKVVTCSLSEGLNDRNIDRFEKLIIRTGNIADKLHKEITS